ncbi:MAG TPA: hypothetical protein VK501_09305 [Baekduia sp.]|uniref:hypothetical protein n=1 Tax=Baekduia sp. TaxID=2600305 RepID=UPI002CC5D754|nr:hypothetical protein [Baekduia sp.]HMJ34103.1 hypothetical protein [Baekduia sp.]
MTTSSAFPFATPAPEPFGKISEQMLAAHREAARLCLDMYEKTLESIADYQEQAANQTDVEWIATVASAQATFVRELAKHSIPLGRELLG